MENKPFDIDAFLEEMKDTLTQTEQLPDKMEEIILTQEQPEPSVLQEPEKNEKEKKPFGKKVLSFLGKLALILVETILLLAVALYGVMYVLAKGPSTTARDIFVMSVRETSAVGFLANLFFTDEEIAQIERSQKMEEYIETDTSLITIQKPQEKPAGAQEETGPAADEWGLVDEDGDGIIIEEVRGAGYVGYMMVVLDPSRVIVGYSAGSTVEGMVAKYDAVAGINAGGFEDQNGTGDGTTPDAMVVSDGKIYYAHKGVRDGFVGIDSNNILHVGRLTYNDVVDRGIRYGVSFGPVLISNGEPATLTSGVNPRTAIGQRSDGAILMLVVDGRQVNSLGATYQDLIDIFQKFGAVNACNLDGGSSSMMWYGDGYVNNCASVVGIRAIPTTFLVLKEGGGDNA